MHVTQQKQNKVPLKLDETRNVTYSMSDKGSCFSPCFPQKKAVTLSVLHRQWQSTWPQSKWRFTQIRPGFKASEPSAASAWALHFVCLTSWGSKLKWPQSEVTTCEIALPHQVIFFLTWQKADMERRRFLTIPALHNWLNWLFRRHGLLSLQRWNVTFSYPDKLTLTLKKVLLQFWVAAAVRLQAL